MTVVGKSRSYVNKLMHPLRRNVKRIRIGMSEQRPHGPLSDLGIPKKPAPERAREILEPIAKDSEKYGTAVRLENGLGIIKVQA